ncbi:hypothetical protein ATO11_11245 [Pseudaestuariivita atlantica]|uniref:B12-binding domain-containing protein n=2 Tax=Pseudaestuariivita atlantica TaxID=1317121 RepID=A0A0L1JPV1_9RHOB|nr:hypothetical protein ATO11_11245 [Pseudaestuariivita atlantica]
MDRKLVAAMRTLILQSPACPSDMIVDEMREAGLDDAQIVDLYIPAVARELGDCWLSDELPFAQVSIGAARLQALLPLLSDAPQDGVRGKHGAGLLIVTRNETHTLGAFVLAHQMRRRGISIHVTVGPPENEVTALVSRGGFDAVLISCAQPSGLVSVGNLVDTIRKTCAVVPPLVLGGAVAQGSDDLVQETGVDHVLTEVTDLLRLFGAPVANGAIDR